MKGRFYPKKLPFCCKTVFRFAGKLPANRVSRSTGGNKNGSEVKLDVVPENPCAPPFRSVDRQKLAHRKISLLHQQFSTFCWCACGMRVYLENTIYVAGEGCATKTMRGTHLSRTTLQFALVVTASGTMVYPVNIRMFR